MEIRSRAHRSDVKPSPKSTPAVAPTLIIAIAKVALEFVKHGLAKAARNSSQNELDNAAVAFAVVASGREAILQLISADNSPSGKRAG